MAAEYRICYKCERELPITREFFYYKWKGKKYLQAMCIKCTKVYIKIRRARNLKNNPNFDKENHQKYKEQRNKYFLERYYTNKQYFVEQRKKWLETENGKKIAKFHKIKDDRRRRNLAKKLIKDLTFKEWQNSIEYFENRCAYCGKELIKITADHFIPLTKGGGLTKSNILPICVSCNSSKKNKNFMEWFDKQPFFNQINQKKIFNYLYNF